MIRQRPRLHYKGCDLFCIRIPNALSICLVAPVFANLSLDLAERPHYLANRPELYGSNIGML